MAADSTRDFVSLDRGAINNFGGDIRSPKLREKYFRLLDRWRRTETGRLPHVLCLLLADEFPREDANKSRTVPNGGAVPAAKKPKKEPATA